MALLNDVLDLAKIEAGRLEVEETLFNLADIVNSAEAIFSMRAHDKGISLAVKVPDEANVWCIGDPTRLKQILYNLISNAVKFTAEGYVNVDVAVKDIKDDNLEIKLSVVDTGIGMDEETLTRLFQRFTQADVSTTRKYGGTGLGLAICKQLAHLMDGDVIVNSELGQGSEFVLTLKLKKGREPAKTDAHSFEKIFEQEGESVGDLRILAAEDNSNNRLVLKTFLEQVDAHPIFVENGKYAVEEWLKQEFDIILMDVQMPVMSGPEATSEIRRLEKQLNRPRTPIIALTANAMTHHVRECLEAGMDAHVAKPIRPDLLFAAIDDAIAKNINKVAEDMENQVTGRFRA